MTVTSPLLLALIILTPQALDLAELNRKVDDRGAKKALMELYDDVPTWQRLLKQVSTAAPKWLQFANRLVPASDAGAANELEISLGDALLRDPRAVLQAIDDVDFACGMFTPPETQDELVLAIRKRETIVGAITDVSLQRKKEQCLADLKELGEGLVKSPKLDPESFRAHSPNGVA
jgi:hypothetical protein